MSNHVSFYSVFYLVLVLIHLIRMVSYISTSVPTYLVHNVATVKINTVKNYLVVLKHTNLF